MSTEIADLSSEWVAKSGQYRNIKEIADLPSEWVAKSGQYYRGR